MGQHSSSQVWALYFFAFLRIKHWCYLLREGRHCRQNGGQFSYQNSGFEVMHWCTWALSCDQTSNSTSYPAFVQSTNAAVWFENGLSLFHEHIHLILVWQKYFPSLRKVVLNVWRLPVGLLCYKTAPHSGSSSACDSNGLLCTWKMRVESWRVGHTLYL